VSVAGDTPIPGAVPVPASDTVLGLPEPLWAIEIEADFPPVLDGVNVTLTVQVAFGVRALVQVLLWANWVVSVPVTDTLLIVRLAVPVLVIVTVCAALVNPASCPPNETTRELKVISGAPPPVPDKFSAVVPPAAL
jgi:hypothetical protein